MSVTVLVKVPMVSTFACRKCVSATMTSWRIRTVIATLADIPWPRSHGRDPMADKALGIGLHAGADVRGVDGSLAVATGDHQA